MGSSSSTARPEAEFETVRELGRGSFGVVRLVRKRGTPPGCAPLEFALKEMTFGGWFTPSTEAQILAEVAILKSLQHPNVVRLQSMWMSRGVLRSTAHVLMDVCVYGSARAYAPLDHSNAVSGAGGSSTQLCRRFAKDVLSGLVYLHGRGVVHRDIKLCNILVDRAVGCERSHEALAAAPPEDLRFCIADFGLSVVIKATDGSSMGGGASLGAGLSNADRSAIQRASAAAGGSTAQADATRLLAQTAARTTCGTLLYIAPELLAAGDRPPSYGGEVDVYATGVALREMLDGTPVFRIPGFDLQRQAQTGVLWLRPFWLCGLASGKLGWPNAVLAAALGVALLPGWLPRSVSLAAVAAATHIPGVDEAGSASRAGLYLLSSCMTARRSLRPSAATALALCNAADAWPYAALLLAWFAGELGRRIGLM